MRVHLGGHLNWYDAQKRAWLDVHIGDALSLEQLLQQLGVPAEEVGVAALNGSVIELESASVSDADRLELYPPVSGGSS